MLSMQKATLLLAFSILIPIGLESAFAQTTYIINIPTGAASPDAPYFWQVESTGNTQGIITITVNDFVSWENADTAAHTVTSGTVEDGPDGKFDSSLFGPGKSFTHQFTEVGNYPYFCIVHPWMAGEVIVTTGFSKVPNVGANVGDGSQTFELEYKFNRVINKGIVDEDSKSITFELVGQTKNSDNTMILKLPNELISGIYQVEVDGQSTTNYDVSAENEMSSITIRAIPAQSNEITVYGSNVVPEFGTIAVLILVASIASIVFFTSRTKLPVPKL